MPTLFADDHVALKEDPSILAVVESTWRDIDPYQFSDEIVGHSGVSKRLIAKLVIDEGPPPDYVVIKFFEPFMGTSLVLEKDLILVDRALASGDLVKRSVRDVESGTVIRQSTVYDLESVLNPDPQAGLWSHQGPRNKLYRIPEEDLTIALDFEIGDYIVWRNRWVGIISNVSEGVTLRLSNGSIVMVHRADDLDVPDRRRQRAAHSGRLSLAATLREFYQRAPTATGRSDSVRAESYHVGQRLYTKKANLRLGKWIFGAYDPAIEPQGTVVKVDTHQISMLWMATIRFSDRRHHDEGPAPNILTTDDFPDVVIYNRNLTAATNARFGTRHGLDLGLGEIVRFKDLSAAALKYSNSELPHGKFERIPRTSTQGYDMNVFSVQNTRTQVLVQWQDGSTTEHLSTELVPHLHADDHDLWPGETVVLRDDQPNEATIPRANLGHSDVAARQMGIVQTVNSKDRIAHVRWYQQPQLMVIDDQRSYVQLTSRTGPLSHEITPVSIYEAVAYPGLNKRRGDLVTVSRWRPAQEPTTPSDKLSTPLAPAPTRAPLNSSQPPETSGSSHGVESIAEEDEPTTETTWFGEVIDLGLDGLVTVRFGALQEIRDVRVSMDRLETVMSGDDASLLGHDEDEASWTDDSMANEDDDDHESDEPIIETRVDYEGGERIDSDGEDVWTTEDEAELRAPRRRRSYSDTSQLATDQMDHDRKGTADAGAIEDHEDLHLSTYPTLPPQFLILDEPEAADHYFARHSPQLSAPLLRRIGREHSILQSSLPEGVWVRTWLDRLDLVRVLILGARDTPYELAPFVLDFHFHDDFPARPPMAHFHSWTQGIGRINPNLYEDGKCCLSLLGTWSTDTKNEGWSTESSMLQVIVSLMGLVLVKEPYYNEAGFEDLVGTPESRVSSALYSEKALVMSKGFVVYALSHTVSSLDGVLSWLYLDADGPRLLQRVVDESSALLDHDGQPGAPWRATRTRVSAGARIMLQRHVNWLRQKLNGLEQA